MTYRTSIFLLSIALFISSCSSSQKETPANPYHEFLSKLSDNGQFNGNVLVMECGKVAYQGSFGLKNIDPVDSLDLNSQFRMASVSKQFTATAIMILKEKGKLEFDQDIRDFIPELPYENVTIRHLLNHTGGLPDYVSLMQKNWKPELDNEDMARAISGNEDILKVFVEKQPQIIFTPGESWAYSNTGYVFLATIVSRASGMPFEDFVKNEIFVPSKMINSVVYTPALEEKGKIPNRVYGFRRAFNGKDLVYNDFHFLNSAQGDGGIFSTLQDLLNWDRIMRTSKLISDETKKEAYSPVKLNNGEERGYGFGVSLRKSLTGSTVIEHSGGWVGFGTHIYRDIENDHCFIFLTNHSTDYFGALYDGIENILYDKPYELPKLSIAQETAAKLTNEGIEAAIQHYRKLKSQSPDKYNFEESQLNTLGYQLLNIGKADEAAAILKLNRDEYSESGNPYDSYGDALLALGDTTEALGQFNKAFEIDSTLDFIPQKIKELTREK